MLIASEEFREYLWDEEEIENKFGLTVSKLRTAQRLALVHAELMIRDRRTMRGWRLTEISRVWVASSINAYAHVPFQASCEIILEFERRGDFRIGESLFSDARLYHSGLAIYDDDVVCFQFAPDVDTPIGCLVVGNDGRVAFKQGHKDVPLNYLSRLHYDGIEARRRFAAIVNKLKPPA